MLYRPYKELDEQRGEEPGGTAPYDGMDYGSYVDVIAFFHDTSSFGGMSTTGPDAPHDIR
jgi:hypothetical protein